MSFPIKPNSASVLFPLDGLNPADYFVDVDHMFGVGATGDAAKPKYVLRQEATTNGGVVTFAAVSVDGRPGIARVATGTAAGGRIQMEQAAFLPAADNPIIMEASVSFVTGGTYIIGWSELRDTNNTVGTSAGFTSGVHGAAALIQSDDKLDVIALGAGDTASTNLTDQITLTAGTWYRIGVITWPTKSEIYVDGRKVSTITHTSLAALPCTPVVGVFGSDNTKILSVDYIGVATGVG
jgi:hypothetical protein